MPSIPAPDKATEGPDCVVKSLSFETESRSIASAGPLADVDMKPARRLLARIDNCAALAVNLKSRSFKEALLKPKPDQGHGSTADTMDTLSMTESQLDATRTIVVGVGTCQMQESMYGKHINPVHPTQLYTHS